MTFTDLHDPRYAAVRRIMLSEPGPLVVPAPVTAEADHLIGARVGEAARRGFLEDLATGQFEVQCLSRVDHTRIVDLERQYADLRLGLADLSVVVIAARLRCTRIPTFHERHFRAIRPLTGGDTFTPLPADA